MVGETATVGVEIIMPLSQGFEKMVEIADFLIGCLFKALDPGIELDRLAHRQRFVRPEGRQDPRLQVGGCQRAVVLQAIHWIISCAQGDHAEPFENPLRAENRRRQLPARLLPDARCALFVQQFINAEVALKLQVSPVIEGIAQRVRHRGRPGLELLKGRGHAGAKALGCAVGAHRPPFVMVALQPDLKQVLELPVLSKVPR